MSGLQGNDQRKAAVFLDRCRVEWRPEQLGLEPALLTEVLLELPDFVRRAKLPHSIINQRPLDQAAATDLLASIPPAPARPA